MGTHQSLPGSLTALVAVAALALTACDAPAPSPPPPSAPSPSVTGALVVPPLRLPNVAADAACPTTPGHAWTGPGVAGAVIGDGPLYPVGDYFQPGTVLRLREADRHPDGTYEAKVRWIGADYTGPVLVRAGRVDGAGSAHVDFSYFGERWNGGEYAALTTAATDIPATTTVDGPGCYAYQVDGVTFSTTIVFRVALVGAD